MRLLVALVKLSVLFCVLLLINVNTSCKDPYEYAPRFDSLMPPPAETPQLVWPPLDTVFWYDMWNPYPNDIELQWTSVEDPQYYELYVSNDPEFPDDPYQAPDTSHTISIDENGLWYWKVRGYNRAWTWFTEWSETRTFRTAYSP